jgi:hypothetical protein
LVKKGVVDGRTGRVREQERDGERACEMVVGMRGVAMAGRGRLDDGRRRRQRR